MILGLGCQKRVGKDTVGDILERDYGFTKLSFASPLKNLCEVLVRFHMGRIEEDQYKCYVHDWASRHNMGKDSVVFAKLLIGRFDKELFVQDETGKYRKLLQYIGTDLIRDQYRDTFWLDIVNERTKELPRCVITDIRFPNEKALIDKIGHAIQVVRPGLEEGTHSSELACVGLKWWYTIDNNGTMEELVDQVGDLIMTLGGEEQS
ncbi:MAG: hypothetical protein D4S01_05975 [Dehalococcoidia bacterium]|nr:MAG: hypothetical protein D4S01_05975 [Dehalococcoidia bacterium]